MRKIIVLLAVAASITSCTENEMAKKYGGSFTEKLPTGQKLVNITWKNNNMWFLTRPMTTGDSAQIYTFQEKSSFGLLEGTVTVIETKK